MTRDEAIASAVAAVKKAEDNLSHGAFDIAYNWSVVADTWAHIARVLPAPITEFRKRPDGLWERKDK